MDISKNINALQKFIKSEKLDGFYISSFDEFLNEYVPMDDCHRYYITNFTGSVAEVLVPAVGLPKVYVDGRYFEQADDEVDPKLVEVVKLPPNTGLTQCLLEDIKKSGIKTIGVEGARTSLKTFKSISELAAVKSYKDELSEFIEFAKAKPLDPIYLEPKEYVGKSTQEKLDMIFSHNSYAYYVTAIDSLAWITNCRGYHLPNLSSFLGRALVTAERVYVFIKPGTPLDETVTANKTIEFIEATADQLEAKVSDVAKGHQIEQVEIVPRMLSCQDFLMLKNVFGEDKLVEDMLGLVKFQCIKDEMEMKAVRNSFKKADKAIYNTIRWVKDKIAAGETISELDIYKQTTVQYEKQGSREQSFNTISGVGPNGAIIHYGNPKEEIKVKPTDMILLDSGGYFEGGWATDTTRTFMAATDNVDTEYKRMFTLTLKGTLACQNAVFPDGCSGQVLDAYARKPLYDHGENFAHGTGHGVGVHVHEDGARISPVGNITMKKGQVVSIEPGFYTPGVAGVRIENIAHVIEHPEHKGFLCFEPLVYIGFETALIDESLLTSEEKGWLEAYEAECFKRGTSFR